MSSICETWKFSPYNHRWWLHMRTEKIDLLVGVRNFVRNITVEGGISDLWEQAAESTPIYRWSKKIPSKWEATLTNKASTLSYPCNLFTFLNLFPLYLILWHEHTQRLGKKSILCLLDRWHYIRLPSKQLGICKSLIGTKVNMPSSILIASTPTWPTRWMNPSFW